jgi:hypothetical protein
MPTKIIRIERTRPRPGSVEVPWWTALGYQLVDPAIRKDRHHVDHAIHVTSLDDAAELIERGFSIRMEGIGKRPSLISPSGIRIVRA